MKTSLSRFIVRATLVAAIAFVFWPAAHPIAQAPAAQTAGKKVLTLADYGPWKRITATSISNDGKWATYTYSPNDGDETLFVKQLDGETTHTVAVGPSAGGGGRGGGGGGGAQFSDDSKWIAYFVNPPRAAGRGRGGAGGAGRGAGAPAAAPQRGGATGAAGAPAAAQRKLQVMDLATGKTFDVPNASGFQFAKGSQFMAIKMNGTAGDTSHRGTDLIVRRMSDGMNQNIGNVYQYDFDDSGRYLAYSVDAVNKLGNGVYFTNPSTGETRALDSSAMDYDGLVWRGESTALAVLRGEKPKGKDLKESALLTWTDATSASGKTEFTPSADASFPKGFVLSEFAAPRWSKDGSKVFVGIKAQQDTSAESAEEKANLDIFHYKDTELQSEQMIRIAQLRRATFAGTFAIASKKFVRLADDTIPAITPTADDKLAIGRDATPYEHDYSEGQPGRADYYAIDTTTGARTLLVKKSLRTMGTSPDSKWFLYLEAGHVMAKSLADGKVVNIDAATGKSFINTDNDLAAEKPIWGVAGWSKDGKSVLLYDKFDVWSMPLDGSKGAMLTAGAGAKDQVQFRITQLGAGGGGGRGGGGGFGGGTPEGLDLSKPQTLTAYGEWTKKTGYFTLPVGGGAPTPLIFADKSIGGAIKAKDADRVLFTEQTFQEFPDYWVTNTSFASPKKLTDANPQIADYAWGSKVLVDYVNAKGKKLQATLTLPAGYTPGKKYPMLVYIYEIMSNTHHTFSMPVYDDRPHMSTYASDGYLVLQPDIVYEIGKPGSSALDCVTAAVKKVIDLGYADPAHIGLQGHSWGGYESSFIVTQTNIFAAVVTGAPLTDLISMYGELYKQSGAWNGGILETSQGRMGPHVTPWNSTALYESQSPVFNVLKIQTPFMILQGTADGAVDWDQGLEFYNAARTNGKNVIFLSYPDEPHHLAKVPNQKDFQIRMKQYFDHYLKGAPMPEWMKNGLPQVRKGEAIK
jgi:dienelactone hydrolase